MKTKQTNSNQSSGNTIWILLTLFIVFGLIVGAVDSSIKTEKHKKEWTQARHRRTGIKPTRFMPIYSKVDGRGCNITVDKKTRVQYIHIGSGVTPLLDSLGKPILYRGKLE